MQKNNNNNKTIVAVNSIRYRAQLDLYSATINQPVLWFYSFNTHWIHVCTLTPYVSKYRKFHQQTYFIIRFNSNKISWWHFTYKWNKLTKVDSLFRFRFLFRSSVLCVVYFQSTCFVFYTYKKRKHNEYRGFIHMHESIYTVAIDRHSHDHLAFKFSVLQVPIELFHTVELNYKF